MDAPTAAPAAPATQTTTTVAPAPPAAPATTATTTTAPKPVRKRKHQEVGSPDRKQTKPDRGKKYAEFPHTRALPGPYRVIDFLERCEGCVAKAGINKCVVYPEWVPGAACAPCRLQNIKCSLASTTAPPKKGRGDKGPVPAGTLHAAGVEKVEEWKRAGLKVGRAAFNPDMPRFGCAKAASGKGKAKEVRSETKGKRRKVETAESSDDEPVKRPVPRTVPKPAPKSLPVILNSDEETGQSGPEESEDEPVDKPGPPKTTKVAPKSVHSEEGTDNETGLPMPPLKKAAPCREDRRQGPRKQHQPQPNQRPSLAGIDGEIGQGGREQ